MLTRVATRIPLILFTGGMDSTYILKNALRTNNVDVLYVDVGQSEGILQKEKTARDAILETLKGGAFSILNQYEVSMPEIIAEHEAELSKATKLVVAANSVMDPQRHGQVLIGGINGDDPITNRDRVGKLWTALTSLSKYQPVPLVFPLAQDTKRNVLELLDEELTPLTSYCEATQMEPCRVCTSCKTVARAYTEYRRVNVSLVPAVTA